MKKSILTYAVIQILKIVLVNVKEMAYSADTVFTALDSTLELKKNKKTINPHKHLMKQTNITNELPIN